MERVERNEFLARIRDDREAFDAIVERVPPERLATPLLAGGWSVKDVLAHIAWGEREGTAVANARALVGSALWQLDEDARNEAVVQESRSRTPQEVVADYQRAFETYWAAVSALGADELNEPDRFAGLAERIPGWRPWRVLYDPEHYGEHGRAIQRALEAAEARATE